MKKISEIFVFENWYDLPTCIHIWNLPSERFIVALVLLNILTKYSFMWVPMQLRFLISFKFYFILNHVQFFPEFKVIFWERQFHCNYSPDSLFSSFLTKLLLFKIWFSTIFFTLLDIFVGLRKRFRYIKISKCPNFIFLVFYLFFKVLKVLGCVMGKYNSVYFIHIVILFFLTKIWIHCLKIKF